MGAACSCRRRRVRDVDDVRKVEERTVETIERKAGSMTLARVNQYRMEQVLGKGSFGAVYRASDMARGDAVAVKVMDKAELRKKMKQVGNKPQQLMPQGTIVSNSILKEIAVMKRVRHAHCACLFEVIDDPLGDRIFLVMELLLGGQVMDEPNLPTNQSFLEEWMARSVFRNLLDGLHYLHCNGILHRDIKPENIVYSERPSFGRGHWTENFDQVGNAFGSVVGSVAGVFHRGTSVGKGLMNVTGDVLEGVASTVAHGAKDAWRVSSKALHHSLSSGTLGDRDTLGDPLSSDSPSPTPATPRSFLTARSFKSSFRGGAMSGAVAPRAGVAAATVVASINGLSTAVAHATARLAHASSEALHDAVDEVSREVSFAGEVAGDLVDGVVGKGLTHVHWAPPAKLLDFGISQVCVRACVDGFAEGKEGRKEKTTRFRSKRRVLRSSTSYFNDTLEKATGTPPYFAPEMLVGKPFRGRPADVWAAGVTLAMITGGRMPYWADNVPEIWRQIERDEPVLADHLSPPLRELLLQMLRKDPAERPTLAVLQEHPWVTDNGALPVSKTPATFTVDEADVATAVQRVFVGLTLFKCASKWKRLPARKRAAREAAKRHGFVSHAEWAPDKPFICHDPPSPVAEALSRSSVQKKRGDPPILQKV